MAEKQRRFIYVHFNKNRQMRTFGTARRAIEALEMEPSETETRKMITTVNKTGRLVVEIYRNSFTPFADERVERRELE